MLISTNAQYAIAVCVEFTPNSYYAGQLGEVASFLALAAGFAQGEGETVYYNQTVNAIGTIQHVSNGYNITVMVINVKALKFGGLQIFTDNSLSYSELAELVNSFANIIYS
ncbi:hypothetical protein HLB03_05270 [Acidianus sp. DSM 29099]|nr:hypothetical protein [Acidianus sp. RZ1]